MVATAKCGRNAAKGKNMKKLIMTAVAAMCCVALAQGPEGEGAGKEGRPEGPRMGERRGPGMRQGGMTPAMMPGMGDPLLRAVSNPKVAENLGLSEEQKAKIKELSASGKSNREAQKKVREATTKQLELMKADKIDEAAVMAAIDEVFDLRKQMAKDQAKRVIDVKSILTPEQIAKAHEEMKKIFESRGDRGPRQGGAPGARRGRGPKGGKHPDQAPEGDDKPLPPPEAE
jgi:Spy/CpxP family protein refolding chaperone